VISLARPALRGLVIATLLATVFLFVSEVEARLGTLRVLGPLFSVRAFLVFAIVSLSLLAGHAIEAAAAARLRLAPVATVVIVLVALVALEGQGYGPHLPGQAPFLRGGLSTFPAGTAGLPDGIVTGKAAFDPSRGIPIDAVLSGLKGRADLSPRLGDLLVGLFLASDARVAPAYTHTLSLLPQSSADRNQALFEPNEYGVSGGVEEAAAWFGIERALLASSDDKTRFVSAGWTVNEAGGLAYAASPQPRTLAAFRERGVALHIGRVADQTYRNTYRFATAGALPFGLGWLVRGPECADDMTLEELRRFDVVILEDHCERSPSATGTIASFVEGGGRLFIETGWEYSRYYQVDDAPPFLPADALLWRPVGAHPTLALPASEIRVADLDVREFGDFEYAGATWNVSAPVDSRLRPSATAVLTADGAPLITTMKLGRGRVVWSGLNLVSHGRAKASSAERLLYRRLMEWLFADATAASTELGVTRLTDDGGDVTIPTRGWLLWRESPSYAEISPSTSGAYRGGPGFLLVPVEPGTYRIEHHPSLGMRLTAALGAVSFVGLVLWLALALGSGGAADPSGTFGLIARSVRRRLPRIGLEEDE
jgi:hypothetical protein